MPPCRFVWWCDLTGSEQAAWAQAVLSVLGLVFATLIPWWLFKLQRDKDAREANVRARSLAIVVAKEIGDISYRLNNFLGFVIRTTPEFDFEAASFAATITPSFRATFPNLHALGDLAHDTQSLAMRLTLVNDLLDNMRAESFDNIPQKYIHQLISDLRLSVTLADGIAGSFEGMFPRPSS
jgi:hypothetical protein